MPELSKEEKFHQYILNLPKEQKDAVRGKPTEVLKLIDDYPEWFMDIGPEKGKFIVGEIVKKQPKIMIELGGYLGYSAVLFANQLIADPEAKYYSFEANAEYAKIAQDVIDLAGLTKKIEIIVGNASYTLVDFKERLKKSPEYKQIDFIFIDHDKKSYVPDLCLCEKLNFVAPGTVIAADNLYSAPEYREYVRLTPEEKKKFPGRWNIIYETEAVEFELKNGRKDAVELTKCKDYLSG
ncbi:uncharacterized protein KGF55_005095 [Candida pseudojiufengensis]|uniref:uncharacterized protein n=1 Tax=Candida pseudojiufengensis TaxID=497109 RepID=UPI0022257B7D|nr:uncharacterized protein KGF55_005095 [Candida pseudojiufengensis]KAI5959863.1 hypothetical protein KGF55_005095 [Candida pseudojiufengensis]